jgi:hypothetical protein
MIKKKLIGFMVLGALTGVGMFNNVPASAKSTAHIVYNRALNGSGDSRNVNLTAKNGIYSKPGILKGARVIVSKSKARTLKESNRDNNNFRAYRVIKTSQGTYYYKVVSFDSQYRGWIYGGKSRTGFYGGVTPFTTIKNVSTKSPLIADGKTTYRMPNSLAGNTDNTFFFQEPRYTQYKVGRKADANHKVITSLTKYKDASFTLVRAIQTTRAGDVWYQIAASNQDINGAWIPGNQISSADAVSDSANSGTTGSSTSTTTTTSTSTSNAAASSAALQVATTAGRTDYFNGNSLNESYSSHSDLQTAYSQGYNAAKSDGAKARTDAIADVKNGSALNKSYSSDLGVQRVYESMYNNLETARNQGVQDAKNGKINNVSYSLDADLQAAYQTGFNSVAAGNNIYQLNISFTVDGVDQSGAFWNELDGTQKQALVDAAVADKLPQTATQVTAADVQKVLTDAKITTVTFNGKTIKFSNADPVTLTPSSSVVQVPVVAHYVTVTQ